jgi:hypothetical protein
MNNQIAKALWKIAEDYPGVDREYIVVFPDRDGKCNTLDCDVWEFRGGVWQSLSDSRFTEEEVGMPKFYIDLPMPRE